MKPTPKLRFVERDEYVRNGGPFLKPVKVRVLQQWWEESMTIDLGWTGDLAIQSRGEWRDVPLEEEK